MTTKGFIKAHGNDFLVGARDKPSNYEGPVARVSHDDTWLRIVTDENEGSAMINIEALPFLRRALAKIAKERKAKMSN